MVHLLPGGRDPVTVLHDGEAVAIANGAPWPYGATGPKLMA
jgi:hypothetical protein